MWHPDKFCVGKDKRIWRKVVSEERSRRGKYIARRQQKLFNRSSYLPRFCQQTKYICVSKRNISAFERNISVFERNISAFKRNRLKQMNLHDSSYLPRFCQQTKYICVFERNISAFERNTSAFETNISATEKFSWLFISAKILSTNKIHLWIWEKYFCIWEK